MADDGVGKLRTEQGGGGGDGGGPEETEAAAGSWLWAGGMLLNVTLLALLVLAAYRLYRRWSKRSEAGGAAQQSQASSLPRMKRGDFTLEQLREYDGSRSPRILLAVNGKVFDVTKGSKFYGPGEEKGGRGPAPRTAPAPAPPPGLPAWAGRWGRPEGSASSGSRPRLPPRPWSRYRGRRARVPGLLRPATWVAGGGPARWKSPFLGRTRSSVERA